MPEKIERSEMVTTYVQRPVTRWKANDGVMFASEADAVAHERGLVAVHVLRHWPNLMVDSDNDSWCIVQNAEELALFCSAWKDQEEDSYTEYSVAEPSEEWLEDHGFPLMAIVHQHRERRYTGDTVTTHNVAFVPVRWAVDSGDD